MSNLSYRILQKSLLSNGLDEVKQNGVLCIFGIKVRLELHLKRIILKHYFTNLLVYLVQEGVTLEMNHFETLFYKSFGVFGARRGIGLQ